MRIKEVKSSRDEHEFLTMPARLYQDLPHWIRPLDKDVLAVFDPKQNPHFADGICARWILKDDTHTVCGRIAAFIDYKSASKNDQPTGGVGFFECINNYEAAAMLFDTSKHWLATNGMQAMDGPINFGERDKWWGLLVDGFDHEPNYCINYNPPYYKTLFEKYGFQTYFNQYTYYRKIEGGIDEGIRERAERIGRSGNFVFCNIEKIPLEKVGHDFQEVYNHAWSSYPDIVPMTQRQVRMLLKQIKPIMDKKLIWFGYYGERPIAFAIMLPEVNQVFKYMNGKLGLWQKLKFFWLFRRGVITKILGVAFGVVPRFQRKGVESAMIDAISRMAFDEQNTFGYKEIEHNWVGDFNPQMMKVHEMMGGTIRKTHTTFRYLFDRSKPFRRAPEVNSTRHH